MRGGGFRSGMGGSWDVYAGLTVRVTEGFGCSDRELGLRTKLHLSGQLGLLSVSTVGFLINHVTTRWKDKMIFLQYKSLSKKSPAKLRYLDPYYGAIIQVLVGESSQTRRVLLSQHIFSFEPSDGFI